MTARDVIDLSPKIHLTERKISFIIIVYVLYFVSIMQGELFMKKTLSLLLSILLLAGVCTVPVSADEPVATTAAFGERVGYSITDNNVSGLGLAFCFTLDAIGVTKEETTHATNLDEASLLYEGVARKISRIGAVITNRAEWGSDTALFVRESVQENPEQIKDVCADKMFKVFEESCSFAIRLTNIPFEQEERLVYVRPYVEILCDSEKVTLYAEAVASTSFMEQAGEPSVSTPHYGTDVDGKGRLMVGDTAVIENMLYLEIVDELDEWMTMYEPVSKDGDVAETLPYMDYIQYACYDAEGNELRTEDKWFGILEVPTMSSQNATVTYEIELPEGTVRVKIVDAQITYWSEWEDPF